MSEPTATTSTGVLAPDPTAQGVAARRAPLWANQRIGLAVLLVALVAIFGSLNPSFFNERNVLFPMVMDIAIFTVVALAQMTVLSIGHMNLAVGRMAAFAAMFAGYGYERLGLPLWPGLLIALVAGGLAGAAAGLVIARTRVNSFVVTLALDFALLGLVALVYQGVTDAAAFTVRPAGMQELRQYSLADLCLGPVCGSGAIPQMVILSAAAVGVIGWIFSRTKLGRELLMTGSNLTAAHLSGIRTNRRIVVAHTISGALAGLAGWMLAVDAGSFKATIGEEFMLPSFLGAVLGGTLLAGGYVSVLGTILGTALTIVIRQGLNLLGFGLDGIDIYLGLILIVAMSSDQVRTHLAAQALRLRTPRTRTPGAST